MSNKKLSGKQLSEIFETICNDEADRIFFEHNVIFSYDHYDSEISTVFVRESHVSEVSVEYEMLQRLVNKLKDIDKRTTLGIYCEYEIY